MTLTDYELSQDDISKALSTLYSGDIDFADIYLQHSVNESWVLEDGIIKDGAFHIETGMGVRAVQGEKTGFAYADEITLNALKRTSEAARGIARQGQSKTVEALKSVKAQSRYEAINPLDTLSEDQKIELLKKVDAHARAQDARVSQVVVSLSGSYDEVLVAATDGTLGTDKRPLIRLNCSVITEQNGRRERGSAGGGARVGYEFFLEEKNGNARWQHFAEEAVRQGLVNLEAKPAPAGNMPVVLGSGWPGVLLHEAVGHGLEGDFNRKGSSAYSGKIGEQVASPLCTIVDDGTLDDRRGSMSIDDEGTPSGYNVLIENGILRG
ncbi:MAG: metalloprotease TldD, partial [Idiomarina sp.]|nr:metalloprotease TldD [Idiomarina sp.]